MMFEISGLDAETSLYALKQAAYKLPIRTRVLSREDVVGAQI
jgi:large subunit ribosomal protein L16